MSGPDDGERLQIDEAMSPEQLHERSERLAVPYFDWIGQPLDALIDGITAAHRSAPPDVAQEHAEDSVTGDDDR